MVVRVATIALQALNWVVVATDDERIVKVCRDHGIDAEKTGAQHPTGSDRVAEVAARLGADYTINLQGDEPLIPPGHLAVFAQHCAASLDPVCNAMARLPATADIGDTTIPKVVVGANHRLAYISRSVIPNATKSSLRPVYFRQIGLYGYGRSALEQYGRFGRRGTCEQYEDIEILRFLDLGLPVSMLELDDYGPAVDLPEHIAAVEAHLARRGA